MMIENRIVSELVGNIAKPQDKLRDLCLDLIYGLQYEEGSFEKDYDNITLVINNKFAKILAANLQKAKKLYNEKKEILNILMIETV
ncbi:hypothetical protein [Klebsiella michiganensis]|uniref:hypothetical protein n=1 Tax=Klebsiella michiganensis TaxID=1134687 RepID=UPI002929BCA6|nr:hypothetical protein [Klebsiella michiganensis]MDV0340993.1 hypothetical protein [Klebsiella michiganensis]MDV0356631.1 hypothetical protein [Klebsiella michiganensis]MDV0404529.1 hypothetical protein [Klebsiella michiganensis]